LHTQSIETSFIYFLSLFVSAAAAFGFLSIDQKGNNKTESILLKSEIIEMATHSPLVNCLGSKKNAT
jgi:hypothetical protein